MSQLLVAFDTETGGLNPKEADLLTMYLCVVDEDFKILDEIDLKLKPDGDRLPIANDGALKVNGINLREHLANPETVTYSEAKAKVVAILKKHLKKTGKWSNMRPLGYNVDFDIDFVQEYILPTNEWNAILSYNKVDPKVVVNFLKDCKWFPQDVGTLVSVAKYLQVPMGTAHTAKADTIATVEVYKKLLELMESKKEGGSQKIDIISMLEAE